MALLFDLDQTLVDSSIAAALRDARRWAQVYPLIRQFSMFDGMVGLLQELVQANVPIAIVTSSPESYCRRVISHFDIPCSTTVCFHDAAPKPSPAPYQLAMKRLEVTTAIAIGDAPKDIQAARAAGIPAIGVSWGLESDAALVAAQPDHLCRVVAELSAILNGLLPKRQD